jgi:hypothetical protein
MPPVVLIPAQCEYSGGKHFVEKTVEKMKGEEYEIRLYGRFSQSQTMAATVS